MNYTINRSSFKELLKQFKDDIIFETELIKDLLSQLPSNYRENFLETLYYTEVYKGELYICKHVNFAEVKYFRTFKEVLEYLNNNNLNSTVTKYHLVNAIENNKPIAGFVIQRR